LNHLLNLIKRIRIKIQYLIYFVEEAEGIFFTVDGVLPKNFFGIEKNFVKPRREVT